MGGNQSQEQLISINLIVQYQQIDYGVRRQIIKLENISTSTRLSEFKEQYDRGFYGCDFYHAFPHSDLEEIQDQEWRQIRGGGTLGSNKIGNNHILNLRLYYQRDCCSKFESCCERLCPCCKGFPCCCIPFCGAFGPFVATGSGSETEKYLMNGDLNGVDADEVRKIVSMKNGDQMAEFNFIEDVDGLDEKYLYEIRQHVDDIFEKSQGQTNSQDLNDFKCKLTKEELITLISNLVYSKLVELFECEPDQIIIRRCQAIGKFMDFHTDVSLKTLQVALNGDAEYEGGRLVYANNGKLIAHKRTAGSITIHDNTIVHGVTRLEKGVRYGLFFLKKRVQPL